MVVGVSEGFEMVVGRSGVEVGEAVGEGTSVSTWASVDSNMGEASETVWRLADGVEQAAENTTNNRHGRRRDRGFFIYFQTASASGTLHKTSSSLR